MKYKIVRLSKQIEKLSDKLANSEKRRQEISIKNEHLKIIVEAKKEKLPFSKQVLEFAEKAVSKLEEKAVKVQPDLDKFFRTTRLQVGLDPVIVQKLGIK